VKKGKKIIVPLSAVQKHLVNAFHVPEEKIAITPEGFDKNLLPRAKTSKRKLQFKRYFLYVGNAYPHKNLQLLIKAYRDFQEKHAADDLGLVMVGKDDYFYKKLTDELKKEQLPRIQHLPDVSHSELAYVYRDAICLLS